MIYTARGQLQHHFWGDYSASIGLMFGTASLARQAQASTLTEWKVSTAHPDVLQFHGTGAALKAQENPLVRLGADRKKLTSLAKSIDYGEPFTITLNTAPACTDVQEELPL